MEVDNPLPRCGIIAAARGREAKWKHMASRKMRVFRSFGKVPKWVWDLALSPLLCRSFMLNCCVLSLMWVILQVGQRSARVATQVPGSFWESSIQCERRENSQKLPETIGYWLMAVFAAFSIVTVGVFFCWQHGDWPQGLTSRMSNRSPERLLSKKIKQAQTRRCRQCNRVNCCAMLLTNLFLLWQIPPAKHFTFWNLAANSPSFAPNNSSTSDCLSDERFVLGMSFSRNTAATRCFVRCSISVRTIPTAVSHGGLGCILYSEILKWWKPALWIAYALIHLHSTSICWTLKAAVGQRLIAHTHIYLMQQEPLLRMLDQNIFFFFFFSPHLSSSLLLLWTSLYALGRLCSPWLWRWSALWQLAFQYETHGW